MLYQIKDGTVSAGGQTILSHVDFYIKEKEKIAVVGKNGAGKTTLLRLLAGELTPDRDDSRGSYGRSNDMVTGAATAGSDLDGTAKRTQRAKKKKPSGNPETGITMSRNITIDMLRQADKSNQDLTIEQILLESCPDKDTFSKERFDYEMEYDRLFTGFGFEKSDKTRLFRSFSGGEQTKISLIKLLLKKPDLLLLDEPTNHLDMKTVEWLEDYLINYPKAVVMVSHDRAFLDAVATGVYELENGALHRYAGNYTQYRQQKLKNLQIQRKAYERQQAEIAHNNELIEKFKHKPKKAAFARSRKTMLARMKLIEKPVEDEAHIFTGNIEPQFPGGKWVYEAKELKIGYDGRALLELSLRIRRGQKIAVIGDNGIGKSTFLKTVAGLILPIKGTSQLGSNLLVGYFDQQSALIDSDKTVRDHFHELFPALVEKDLRKTLGMYLFGGANASKRISSLSGGEKSRLVLAELLTGRPNLMILDEPTNHMDIPAKETLESAFKAYTGTMLFVSHDRYFIKQVADAILVFENDKVMYYPFGYDHYISRLKASQDGNLPALMQAKDAAMVEALAAVPKRERHETRQLSTDEAYLEWKLTLAAEPMMKAADEAEKVYEELCEAEIALKAEMLRSCDFCEKISCGNNLAVEDKSCDISNGKLNQNIINTDTTKENVDKLRLQYEKVADSWTNECIKWYDIYLNEMYPDNDF
ncbi:ATP-binding cassette domain-containing protein [[Eubacterium] rectale]|uniref:ATP-binding cassette domain-containing protein n=1 Tax=Agathobacter rectalis TaxID=39491 RepID=A0A7X2M9A6_9FIRM|nr:ABC-F family ATP-binding cassette domain-containing protein [Agathobacter rectalis]MSC53856.1 ATP-binding cassette domain-containing protein [Agathobacter rectalis]MSC87255.1 ATP-binding cassette domain-containing protein [Agathobacter rectalis]MSD09628.1 ATP-binding cassette domain-containing protein [Agathobacter rectalis]MSD18737.1 ATP-binding cassette domain-containing protein [Agathobacter rectalis]MSD21258.1 ATP-binding cassette domain-containing protein [Agathobacter rectalis]